MKKYGHWTVLKFRISFKNYPTKDRARKIHFYHLCKCKCGKIEEVAEQNLNRGLTTQCRRCREKWLTGERNGRYVHGTSHTSERSSWSSMLIRCYDKRYRYFYNYGGRGILVCKRWLKFENFYKDMGKRPKNTSLDRVDNEKGYSPKNCRWATRAQQAANRRDTKRIGSRCLKHFCKDKNISYTSIQYRLGAGWTMKDALSVPVDRAASLRRACKLRKQKEMYGTGKKTT